MENDQSALRSYTTKIEMRDLTKQLKKLNKRRKNTFLRKITHKIVSRLSMKKIKSIGKSPLTGNMVYQYKDYYGDKWVAESKFGIRAFSESRHKQ